MAAHRIPIGLLVLLAFTLAASGPRPLATAAPAEGEARAMARNLWQELQSAGYRQAWATVPGKGTFYQGQPPHGALLSMYLNPEAQQGMQAKAGEMPTDAVIVKENYTPERTLDAVTVMHKEPGYNPEHGNWFWAKYGPDGSVQEAGKVAGCIGCHGAVRSNDYIFTFPIALRQP